MKILILCHEFDSFSKSIYSLLESGINLQKKDEMILTSIEFALSIETVKQAISTFKPNIIISIHGIEHLSYETLKSFIKTDCPQWYEIQIQMPNTSISDSIAFDKNDNGYEHLTYTTRLNAESSVRTFLFTSILMSEIENTSDLALFKQNEKLFQMSFNTNTEYALKINLQINVYDYNNEITKEYNEYGYISTLQLGGGIQIELNEKGKQEIYCPFPLSLKSIIESEFREKIMKQLSSILKLDYNIQWPMSFDIINEYNVKNERLIETLDDIRNFYNSALNKIIDFASLFNINSRNSINELTNSLSIVDKFSRELTAKCSIILSLLQGRPFNIDTLSSRTLVKLINLGIPEQSHFDYQNYLPLISINKKKPYMESSSNENDTVKLKSYILSSLNMMSHTSNLINIQGKPFLAYSAQLEESRTLERILNPDTKDSNKYKPNKTSVHSTSKGSLDKIDLWNIPYLLRKLFVLPKSTNEEIKQGVCMNQDFSSLYNEETMIDCKPGDIIAYSNNGSILVVAWDYQPLWISKITPTDENEDNMKLSFERKSFLLGLDFSIENKDIYIDFLKKLTYLKYGTKRLNIVENVTDSYIFSKRGIWKSNDLSPMIYKFKSSTPISAVDALLYKFILKSSSISLNMITNGTPIEITDISYVLKKDFESQNVLNSPYYSSMISKDLENKKLSGCSRNSFKVGNNFKEQITTRMLPLLTSSGNVIFKNINSSVLPILSKHHHSSENHIIDFIIKSNPNYSEIQKYIKQNQTIFTEKTYYLSKELENLKSIKLDISGFDNALADFIYNPATIQQVFLTLNFLNLPDIKPDSQPYYIELAINSFYGTISCHTINHIISLLQSISNLKKENLPAILLIKSCSPDNFITSLCWNDLIHILASKFSTNEEKKKTLENFIKLPGSLIKEIGICPVPIVMDASKPLEDIGFDIALASDSVITTPFSYLCPKILSLDEINIPRISFKETTLIRRTNSFINALIKNEIKPLSPFILIKLGIVDIVSTYANLDKHFIDLLYKLSNLGTLYKNTTAKDNKHPLKQVAIFAKWINIENKCNILEILNLIKDTKLQLKTELIIKWDNELKSSLTSHDIFTNTMFSSTTSMTSDGTRFVEKLLNVVTGRGTFVTPHQIGIHNNLVDLERARTRNEMLQKHLKQSNIVLHEHSIVSNYGTYPSNMEHDKDVRNVGISCILRNKNISEYNIKNNIFQDHIVTEMNYEKNRSKKMLEPNNITPNDLLYSNENEVESEGKNNDNNNKLNNNNISLINSFDAWDSLPTPLNRDSVAENTIDFSDIMGRLSLEAKKLSVDYEYENSNSNFDIDPFRIELTKLRVHDEDENWDETLTRSRIKNSLNSNDKYLTQIQTLTRTSSILTLVRNNSNENLDLSSNESPSYIITTNDTSHSAIKRKFTVRNKSLYYSVSRGTTIFRSPTIQRKSKPSNINTRTSTRKSLVPPIRSSSLKSESSKSDEFLSEIFSDQPRTLYIVNTDSEFEDENLPSSQSSLTFPIAPSRKSSLPTNSLIIDTKFSTEQTFDYEEDKKYYKPLISDTLVRKCGEIMNKLTKQQLAKLDSPRNSPYYDKELRGELLMVLEDMKKNIECKNNHVSLLDYYKEKDKYINEKKRNVVCRKKAMKRKNRLSSKSSEMFINDHVKRKPTKTVSGKTLGVYPRTFMYEKNYISDDSTGSYTSFYTDDDFDISSLKKRSYINEIDLSSPRNKDGLRNIKFDELNNHDKKVYSGSFDSPSSLKSLLMKKDFNSSYRIKTSSLCSLDDDTYDKRKKQSKIKGAFGNIKWIGASRKFEHNNEYNDEIDSQNDEVPLRVSTTVSPADEIISTSKDILDRSKSIREICPEAYINIRYGPRVEKDNVKNGKKSDNKKKSSKKDIKDIKYYIQLAKKVESNNFDQLFKKDNEIYHLRQKQIKDSLPLDSYWLSSDSNSSTFSGKHDDINTSANDDFIL